MRLNPTKIYTELFLSVLSNHVINNVLVPSYTTSFFENKKHNLIPLHVHSRNRSLRKDNVAKNTELTQKSNLFTLWNSFVIVTQICFIPDFKHIKFLTKSKYINMKRTKKQKAALKSKHKSFSKIRPNFCQIDEYRLGNTI